MSDRESKLQEELADREAQIEDLIEQRNHAIARLQDSSDAHESVRRLIRIAKAIDQSITWKMGRAIVNAAARIMLRSPKPGFIHEVSAIENRHLREGRFIDQEIYADSKEQVTQSDSRAATEKVRRRYDIFDTKSERDFVLSATSYRESNPAVKDLLVSIIMPTFNRANTLARAIRSVQSQTHLTWELLIIDDGSTDETAELIETFNADRRIHYRRIDKAGVGGARNNGLAMAQGEVVAFLDSDNEWRSDYLSLTVAGLKMLEVPVVYSGVSLFRHKELVGYRGDVFDYDACRQGNYVDLNCFAHLRQPFLEFRFDIGLRRYNDWDYILNVCACQQVEYLPFNQVIYHIETYQNQISLTEPTVYRKIVTKRYGDKDAESFDAMVASVVDIVDKLIFSIAICLPQRGASTIATDYYSGLGMGQALQRAGHQVKFYEADESVPIGAHDISISVRGSVVHNAMAGCLNVLWCISEPERLEIAEIDAFDLILVASQSFADLLRVGLRAHSRALPEAVDLARSPPCAPHSRNLERLIYVGNYSLAAESDLLASIKSFDTVQIYGNGWANSELSNWMSAPRLSRYHEPSVFEPSVVVAFAPCNFSFEFLNAMVLDAIMAGATVWAKYWPVGFSQLGDQIFCAADVELADLAKAGEGAFIHDRAGASAAMIASHHSYDQRASKLLDYSRAYLTNSSTADRFVWSSNRLESSADRFRVAVFPQVTSNQSWTSSVYIRLVLPLSSSVMTDRVEFDCYQSVNQFTADVASKSDFVVISRAAVKEISLARQLIEISQANGVQIIVDVDDGFHLMDTSHPEYESYSSAFTALTLLMISASEIWCATAPLLESLREEGYANTYLVENTLDARLWHPRPGWRTAHRSSPDALQMLYMGSRTHQDDLEFLLPVLDRLAANFPGEFELTLIGIVTDIPQRPWLKLRTPEGKETEYPHFARWMRNQAGQYDVGVAPLTATRFNSLKSDLKVLEYIALDCLAVVSATDGYENSSFARRCVDVDDWYEVLVEFVTARHALRQDTQGRDLQADYLWNKRATHNAAEIMFARMVKLKNQSEKR